MGAILKLLALREKGHSGMGVFEIWLSMSGQSESYREDFTFADIITSLPAFTTTGTYTDDALIKVKTADHALLKEKYQKVFLRNWEEKKDILEKQYGITEWEAVAYNGLEEKRGVSQFSDAGRGGLKIEFFGGIRSRGIEPQQKSKIACIWMRGSATEPIFRIMADAADLEYKDSGLRLERALIEWQRQMVALADDAAPPRGGA